MDRFSGTNYVTIGGIRQFVDLNLSTNTPGSNPNALWFNGAQESILAPVVAAGLVPSDADNTQLLQAIKSLPPGRLLNVQHFISPGSFSYVPTTDTSSVRIMVVGAGGASGGAPATGSGQQSCGGPGGGGALALQVVTAGFAGAIITVGAGGTPSPGSVGGTGGASSFGSFVAANGGAGGAITGPTGAAALFAYPGQGAGAGTSGYLNAGGNTPAGQQVLTSLGIPTLGGASLFFGFGQGGMGTFNYPSAAALPGFAGTSGCVIVEEYS